ncbi:CBS domain-containing protein [Teichococcus aestuarii]|uniref:CBS domain-containing protein n=1 Tax=Teichococcus aestuarii TaxID=568898 RepID=A0A2U1V6Z7_9PROT|nr:CBS domain-containing protein [Pseudoroseomonas aestuarii]PWC29663.1 CBS domain-containing protein [Pseudoroseomonas aestuarii]
MTIANILRGKGSQVVSVGPQDDAAAVARTLAQHRIGAVLVRDAQGGVLGILSERDIVRALAGQPEGIGRLQADQLMTRVLHTVSPETPITAALSMVTDRRVRHLPVLDGAGALVGMVSIGDLVKARIAEAEQEASDLRNYVTSGG